MYYDFDGDDVSSTIAAEEMDLGKINYLIKKEISFPRFLSKKNKLSKTHEIAMDNIFFFKNGYKIF
jgi:hypothetical protein